MKSLTTFLAIGALLAPISTAFSQGAIRSFSFNAASVSGFPSGAVFLTGGGTLDTRTGSVHAGGAFRCTQDINQGPFAGLRAGDGVRWDAEELLPSIPFKCTGSSAEAPRTATTGDNTIVLKADFYRQGDGSQASLHANMFLSTDGGDGTRPGATVVWIQGVGCADAIVNIH